MALSRASVSLEPGSTVVDGGWGGCVRAMYTIGSRRVEVSGGCECIEWDGSDRQVDNVTPPRESISMTNESEISGVCDLGGERGGTGKKGAFESEIPTRTASEGGRPTVPESLKELELPQRLFCRHCEGRRSWTRSGRGTGWVQVVRDGWEGARDQRVHAGGSHTETEGTQTERGGYEGEGAGRMGVSGCRVLCVWCACSCVCVLDCRPSSLS